MSISTFYLQSNYEEKLDKVVHEYELKMAEDNKSSVKTLAKELNAANNSKEELCQRVATTEIAYGEKKVEVRRLHREIVAFAPAFNEKVVAEVLAANVAFNEKLAMEALEIVAHSSRKLDVELGAEEKSPSSSTQRSLKYLITSMHCNYVPNSKSIRKCSLWR
jgi:hypothetical protein